MAGSQSVERLARARDAFQRAFGVEARTACDAPGRVNLIGEHIDYAGGSVLPFAIQHGIAVAAGVLESAERRVEFTTATTSPVNPDTEQLAAAERLADEILRGLAIDSGHWQFAVWSDLPIGAGLASSAALGIALAGAILGVGTEQCSALLHGNEAGRSIAPPLPGALQLCQLCRSAEEAATGVQCGLMDQYASMFGQAGQAVHFGTVSLTHQYAPLALPDALLAVIDSGQPRTLGDTAYNERRAELARGHRGRVRHVQAEKKRVVAAFRALAAGDVSKLGELLNASHASLRDDFEVSTPQLDLLCRLLTADGLAHGARLTGAGFGGSVLVLLRRDAIEPGCIGECPLDLALAEYERETGLKPVLRFVTPSDGATVQTAADNPMLLRDWLPQPTKSGSVDPRSMEPVEAPA